MVKSIGSLRMTPSAVKAGTDPETAIYAHSEARFSLGANFIEFQRDRAGTVTGLIYEQGSQKIPALRIR